MEILFNIFVMFISFITLVFTAVICQANIDFYRERDFKTLAIGILFLIASVTVIILCINYVFGGVRW